MDRVDHIGMDRRFGILVPLDGSSLAERAITPAVALAGAGLPVTLLRAVPALPLPESGSTGGRRPALAEAHHSSLITHHSLRSAGGRRTALAEAEAYLVGLASHLAEHGVLAIPQVQPGDAADVILRSAVEQQPELVVMATHGRSGLGRWVYGSVAEAVLSRSPVPVLLVRAAGPPTSLGPATRQPRVVVPLDGSAFAEEAVPVAVRLARLLGGTLVLVRAIPPVPALVGAAPFAISAGEPATRSADRADAQASVDRVAEQLAQSGVRFRTRVADGHPAERILDVCQAENASLVVMATHGRTGLRRLVFGSIAAEVLHRGQTPILFVRPAAMAP